MSVLPMATCQPQDLRSQPFEPAVRIQFPDRCLAVDPFDTELFPRVSGDVVVWYLWGTGTVFGYSQHEDGNLYKTVDCVNRSPA
jgi:hypothetical protein